MLIKILNARGQYDTHMYLQAFAFCKSIYNEVSLMNRKLSRFSVVLFIEYLNLLINLQMEVDFGPER